MTEKRFWRLIALAAALGLGVCAALAAWPGLIELPFKLPCGYFVDLLWDISKTGAVWRILAIILYVLVCLVPAGALFLISRRRRPWREDWLLALLSVVLLLLVGRALDRNWTIYSAFAQMGLLAVLVTWLALRLLRYFSASDDRRLVRLVRIVVVLIGMLFAALAGVSAFAILAALFERFSIPALAEGAGSVASSGITVYGCLLGLRLVDSLGEGGELTDDTVDLARGFYRYSVRGGERNTAHKPRREPRKTRLRQALGQHGRERELPRLPAAVLPRGAHRLALHRRAQRAAGRQRSLCLMAIRVHLDEVLRERGMTAKELCAKVGITEANLSILRSGKAGASGSEPSTASATTSNATWETF